MLGVSPVCPAAHDVPILIFQREENNSILTLPVIISGPVWLADF